MSCIGTTEITSRTDRVVSAFAENHGFTRGTPLFSITDRIKTAPTLPTGRASQIRLILTTAHLISGTTISETAAGQFFQ